MGTQKPLVELIPDILKHITDHHDYLEFNQRLYRVAEGQVKDEVEKSLAKEIISPAAYRRAKERIPSINMIKKAADKLSKVYIEPPKRLTDRPTDQTIMENIASESMIDRKMNAANWVLNVHHTFALEPYIENRKHRVRVLPGHQFLPYSDDPVDPNRMTVFIKLLGIEFERKGAVYNENGDLVEKDEIREISLFALYSDDEWAIIDNGGTVRTDKMAEMGVDGLVPGMPAVNPFGRIPYVHGKVSSFELIQFPNQQGFDISVLIPKLLTDLNYAAQFATHSIIWSKNADLSDAEFNPDAVVDLGESSDGSDPEIGVLKPEVDIPETLKLIEFEAEGYFSSLGIKVSTGQTMANGRDASALAKALDEGDVTGERKRQTEFFRGIELQLWDLIADMQPVFAATGAVDESRTFSSTFTDSFRVVYPEMRPVKTFNQKIEEVRGLRDLKMITRKRSLQMLMPEMTEKQIDEWVQELDDEAIEFQQKMLDFGVNLGPERQSDGTFVEGNQAAAEQDETSKDETDMDERVN